MAYSLFLNIEVKIRNGAMTQNQSYTTTITCKDNTDFGIQEGARNYVLNRHPGWTIVDMTVKKK